MRPHNREDSRGSEAGTAESWEFRSVQETPERQDNAAPIARLESLDELETSQVRVMVTHRIGVCLQQLSLLVIVNFGGGDQCSIRLSTQSHKKAM